MARLHWRYLGLVPVVVLIILLAMPSVALADNGTGRFSIFDSISVAPGETVNGDVGSIFSSVDVRGTVNGNVFSVFSSVSVSGDAQVHGSVTSVFSSVSIAGRALVTGDVTSAFSSVSTASSATVLGTKTSGIEGTSGRWPENVTIDWGDWPNWRFGGRWGTGSGYWLSHILSGVFSALLLAAAGIVTVVLFPRRVEVVKDTVVRSPWSSLGVGFLGLMLSLPLALILLITCIGFFVVVFGTFLATLLGLVAIGAWIGDRVMDTTDSRPRSPVIDVAVGSFVLALVMATLDLVPYIGWLTGLLWFALFSLAFGAALLSRFGSVPPVALVAPTLPVPPAPPEAPTPTGDA